MVRYIYIEFKWTVWVISSEPPWTDDNARFPTVLYLYLINNVEDIVVLKGVYISIFYDMLSCSRESTNNS